VIRLFGVTLEWPLAAQLVAAILGVVVVAVLVAAVVERALATWARRRGIAPEDAALPAVRRYLLPALLVGALHVAVSVLDLPRSLRMPVSRVLAATTLALALYLGSHVVLAILARVTRRSDPGRRAAPQLLTMTRIALLLVSLAILLDNLGVRVTALVTTLGVGSLAVALALQDTLSNFFAGVYLQADRPFRIGDVVRIDTGDEGRVVDIGWRSTRFRTAANNTVIVPNERLLKSVITNYSLPDPHIAVAVRVTVPYGSEVEKVEHALTEAARRAAADTAGILPAPVPTVRLLPGFGDQGLAFTVTVWVREFADQDTAQDAVRRHAVALFREYGVEIRRG
jgi:small-conductance mechanosensitive channel